LDRELARDLGRTRRQQNAARTHDVDALEQRAAPEAERRLVAAAQRGDAAARARLVEAFIGPVAALARRYRGAHVEQVELIQEGVVGLLRALDGFDLDRGTPFWAYASWWVRQAMQQLVAELGRPVTMSDRALRSLARVHDAHRAAVAEGRAEPSRAELAERTGLSATQIDELLASDRVPRSLEEPLADDDRLGTLGELVADPLAEGEYERVLDEIEAGALHALLAGLSDREREVLRARFADELSLREVGARMGLSYERVRQIEQRALAKLTAPEP
jgi:RNA polymerase sigma factor (sigma-70 family)